MIPIGVALAWLALWFGGMRRRRMSAAKEQRLDELMATDREFFSTLKPEVGR